MATLRLERHINRIRRRIRVLHALRWSVLFALGGTLVAVVAAGIAWARHALFPLPEVALFLATCAGLGAFAGYLRRVTPFQAALITDRRLGLQERLSSALELGKRDPRDPLVAALVADATSHAEGIDPRTAYPLRARREAHLLAGALGVLALVLLLPRLPFLQSPQQRAERAAMRAEGERIVRVAREMRKAGETRHSDLERRIARNLEQLGQSMRSSRVDKKQALMKLHALTQEIKEAQKQLASEGAKRSLAQASEALMKEARARSGETAQRLQQMAEALAREEMGQAARLLEEMGERVASGKISAREREQMAGEAERIAESLAETPLQEAAQQLAEAARLLRQGQMQAAAEQMQQACGSCQGGGCSLAESQMQQAGEAVEQSRQRLALAGQEAPRGGEEGAPGGGQTLVSGDAYATSGQDERGQGRGQRQTVAGSGGPEAGRGVTDEQTAGGAPGSGTPRDRQADQRPEKRARFEQVYAPNRIPTNRLDTQVRGKKRPGKSDYSEARGAPEQGSASRPYYEVYSHYQRTAEEALAREEIPAAYRKQVRDYFDSLRP
ncbi:MAG TPA: hypothetical protein GX715_11790 [Armatimonadetes bacterium]|jgi:hypothetical protein|nr:hypothetical protein [Armatimonadota bacterium]